MKYLPLVLFLIVTGCGGLSTPNGTIFNGPAFKNETGIFGPDKGKHWIGGVVVATGTRIIATEFTTWTRKEVVIAGCVASATVGIAKEFYDRDVMGTRFDPVDAAWTAAGCLMTFEWVF